ncbi:unnamed protein product, partial [marine sediment metagenome]
MKCERSMVELELELRVRPHKIIRTLEWQGEAKVKQRED